MNIPIISIPFFLTAAALFGLAWHAWSQHSTVGARAFSLFMFSIGIYALGYGFELGTHALSSAIFWNIVQYIGILSFPVLYLIFVFQFIGQPEWLNFRSIAMLLLPAILLFAVKLFDQNLHWIYASSELLEINGRMLFTFTRGPLYLYVSVYQVFTVTVATFLIIQKRRFASDLFRKQTNLMLASGSIVYLVYFTYLLGFPLHSSLEGIDVNPLAFGVLAAGASVAIFRHGFLELVPVARDALIETLNDGVVVLDSQTRIVDANPKAARIFGWETTPLGQPASSEIAEWMSAAYLDEIKTIGRREMEVQRGRSEVYYELTISLLSETRGSKLGYLVLVHDVTDQKMVENKLAELSLLDDLTGLSNRRGFNVLAEQLLGMASRMHLNALLFYADIDGLKTINDTLGHAAGDQAIRDAAAILKDSFRSSDVVARISGDEFVLLSLESSENSAEMMLERLASKVADHAKWGRDFKFDISAGVAQFDWQNPKLMDTLLEEADKAMYEVKQVKKSKKKKSASP